MKYTETELRDVAPLALSFVGDAVHTLFVRDRKFGLAPYSNDKLHDLSKEECKASAQAEKTKLLVKLLNDDEMFIYKKCKNAKVKSVPKNASLYEYSLATAFEGVIGYLYLCGKEERITELFNKIYD